MIIRARALVTMDGKPIANGAVAIGGNRILDVGRWEDVRACNVGEATDLGECVLLPGLINAHCHLDYTDLRGAIPRPSSFSNWIRAINDRKASWSDADYVRSIEHGFVEAARFGTTTIVNLEAFPRLISAIVQPPLRTWWFAEMIDVREAVSAAAVYAELSAALADSEMLGGIGLAPHAPYTSSPELYASAAGVAARHEVPLTTHVAESREEMAMFRHRTGPLFEFLESIGRRMDDCGGMTPLALLLERRLLDERWIVAHLNELTAGDFDLLERAPKFHLAHCPRSHEYFCHTPFAMTELRGFGFNICLGTDSLASNADLSLFAEMRQLSKTQPSLLSQELLATVTINPAAALRQEHELGRLRVGYLADMLALPFNGQHQNVFDEIISFEKSVFWMMIDGRQVDEA